MAKSDRDDAKARSNLGKHAVSFDEAESVFEPSDPAIFDDLSHSESEPRYIAIGFSNKQRLLVVSFTRRSGTVRIISARRATKTETEQYAKAKSQSS